MDFLPTRRLVPTQKTKRELEGQACESELIFSAIVSVNSLSQTNADFPVELAGPAHEQAKLPVLRIDPKVGVMIANPAVYTLGYGWFVMRWIVQHEQRKAIDLSGDGREGFRLLGEAC